MSASAAFAVGSAGRGTVDFAAAVLSRIDRRSLAWGTVVVVALIALAGFGLVTMVWDASSMAKLSRMTHTALAALVVVAAVLVADEAVERGLRPLPTYAVAVVAASVLGSLVGFEALPAFHLDYNQPAMSPLFAWVRRVDVTIICTLVGGLAAFAHVSRRNALAAMRRQREAEGARARAGRRTLESELQALQARVEPMFLFGTLERIRQLYRSDATEAGAMLQDLIVYLRAALPHLRESSSTVEKETALAQAWLDIVGRSAPGRQIEFDIAAAAREARLPALVMLPLVQQAVGDGEAGALRLRVSVGIVAGRLRIEVATSGDAFAAGIEARPLLEQIAERLRALYGAGARFEAAPGDGAAAGSKAQLELPLELDDSELRGASR